MNKFKTISIAACLMLIPLVTGCDDNGSSNSAEEQAREAGERASEEALERSRVFNAALETQQAAIDRCDELIPPTLTPVGNSEALISRARSECRTQAIIDNPLN